METARVREWRRCSCTRVAVARSSFFSSHTRECSSSSSTYVCSASLSSCGHCSCSRGSSLGVGGLLAAGARASLAAVRARARR